MTTNPNAPLEAFDRSQDRQNAWMEGLATKTPTPSNGIPGINWETGVAGGGSFQRDAAPSLDEIEGSYDPDSFE
jgi:hypothetical protein